jgi:hypothetical protein
MLYSSTDHQTTSPSSSSNKSSTITNNSQPSSLAYVYDANSSSAPFKIREKSTSSVTVVSSDSSMSYWSNPIQMVDRAPSNVMLQPQQPHIQQSIIADILNMEDHHYNVRNTSFLSSSVPSENTTFTTVHLSRQPLSFEGNKISSAPSSPTRHRSRSQSFSTQPPQEDSSSLKHLLTNLMNGESSYLDQTEDVKLVRRWVKFNGQVYLANFILVLLSDGLCAVVICKDDPEKVYIIKKKKKESTFFFFYLICYSNRMAVIILLQPLGSPCQVK